MNTPEKRNYTVLVKKNRKIHFIKIIQATDRRKAVKEALWWFWYKYKGKLGPACHAMTVNDPYKEVTYRHDFRCNDQRNKFLSLETCHRLIAESNGELVFDTRTGTRFHQPNSLRRVKRRRDFGRFIAPNVRQMANGVLYYRVTTKPQLSRNGKLFRKRKYRDIRLRAKNLESAVIEIETRQLQALNNTARDMCVRNLELTAHILGVTKMERGLRKFRRVLKKYHVEESHAIPAA